MLNRLQIWKKLAVLAIGLLVPSVFLGYQYLRIAMVNVEATEREIQGGQYLAALTELITEISQHRGESSAFINGEKSFRENALATQAAIHASLAKVDAVDAQVGGDLQVKGRWGAIEARWRVLEERALGLPTASEAYTEHSAILHEISDLVDAIGDNSALTLDPEKSTYYLQDAAFQQYFNTLSDIGALRDEAMTTSARGAISSADLPQAYALRDEISRDLDAIKTDLNKSAAVSPVVKESTSGPQQQLNDAAAALRDLVFKRIIAADSGAKVSVREAFDAGIQAAGALKGVSVAARAELETELNQRLSSIRAQRNLSAAVLLLFGIGAILLCRLITRSMTRPMSQAITTFEAISAGRYDNDIEQGGTDEVGQVLHSLGIMQGKLRTQIESERAAAAANDRIKSGLDKASAAIMLADEELRIIYVNESAQTLFRAGQAEFKRDLPALDADRLMGSSVDMFYRDPAGQRALLSGLNSTHTTDVSIGGRSMRIAASPVLSKEDVRIGTVVEWWDRTQEVRAEEEVSSIVKEALGGDLTRRVISEGKVGFYATLSRGLNQLLENVSQIVAQVKLASTDVCRGAEEISQGNANLSQRTEQQSASLEETASSMEQMTATVRQNADNASQANQLAVAARDQAENGGVVVGDAVRAMAGINESAKRISDIIGVIDEIAFQTNLLALNAAVEAARAGEQGRGFAVVASEVRSLAGRSATAAKEIKELIEDSVKKVEDGAALVTRSGQTLDLIMVSVKKVSDIVGEIAAASREQSSGIDQVNKAVAQMDEMTQQNAALVEQASAASNSMAEQARSLNDTMSRFQVGTASAVGRPGPHPTQARDVERPVSAVSRVRQPGSPDQGSSGPGQRAHAVVRARQYKRGTPRT
jgi:methyl-accepting chemotaxis protein